MTNRMSVYIDDDLHKKFKHLCVEEGISITKKVVDLIKRELEKKEKINGEGIR